MGLFHCNLPFIVHSQTTYTLKVRNQIGGDFDEHRMERNQKNKAKFLILGSIIFLVSFLTFIISGLANGLSKDNAALIKNLPDGQFYMTKEAEETYNLSSIDRSVQESVLNEYKDAVAFSIGMGFVNDERDKQRSVSFVTSTDSKLFPNLNKGEVILDSSLKKKESKLGTRLLMTSMMERLW